MPNAMGVFVQFFTEEQIIVAHSPLLTPEIVLELQRYFNRPIEFRAVPQQKFKTLLARAYEIGTETKPWRRFIEWTLI